MPCRPAATYSGKTGYSQSGGGYATEADCLQACKEGACCESNGTCSIKPQCQCQGTGQTFRGAGTPCTQALCSGVCGCPAGTTFPSYFNVTFSGFVFNLTQALSGSPPSTSSELKNYIEGLSPLVFPVVNQTSQAIYRRFRCTDLKSSSDCQPMPPGFFSSVPTQFLNERSLMQFGLLCGTTAFQIFAAHPGDGVDWQIDARNSSFTVFLTILLKFTSSVVFDSICALNTQQASVSVVPQISGGTLQTYYLDGSGSGRYSGSGTVQFEPMYSPLP
jgi:hypothetical protein